MTDELRVGEGVVVSLDYTVRLEDGEVVDTSSGVEPLQYMQGYGQIISGLEKELSGMAIGDEKMVVVGPNEGYGERNPDAFQEVPREVFPPDMLLEPGTGLHVRDESGQVFEVQVAKADNDHVLLDFNHPLAGKTLYFDVKIAGLRPATAEEQEHGHVHGAGHGHEH